MLTCPTLTPHAGSCQKAGSAPPPAGGIRLLTSCSVYDTHKWARFPFAFMIEITAAGSARRRPAVSGGRGDMPSGS